MISLQEISSKIKSLDNFILLGHVDPDGDCIGSLFALKWILDKLGKQSLIILEEPPADKYTFLSIVNDDYCLFKDFELEQHNQKLNFIALDAGDRERLGPGEELLKNNLLINIDHHPDNPAYGNLNHVNPDRAAVGEIIFELVNELAVVIDQKIGSALTLAVITDTGGFRYQNTTTFTFKMMARLLEAGIDLYQINRCIYGHVPFADIKLKGIALSTIQLSQDGKIAWLQVDDSARKEANTDLESSSGLVNLVRDISGVEVGILFTEVEPEETRASFRSNEYCPVNEIAAFFGGGGHARAAGCTVQSNLDDTIKMILKKVKEYV